MVEFKVQAGRCRFLQRQPHQPRSPAHQFWAAIAMASSKVTTLLPALSTRFARSFGFSLDGAASCLQSRACSVWASTGTCCGSEEAIEIEDITSQTGPSRTAGQAENVASAQVEGGNGFIGGSVPRAGTYGSPAGSSCLPPSHHAPTLFSSPAVSWAAAQPYGMLCRGVRTLAADIKTGNVVEIKGKLQEVTKTVWTMQVRQLPLYMTAIETHHLSAPYSKGFLVSCLKLSNSPQHFEFWVLRTCQYTNECVILET
jgi:hypothetical protein